MIFPSPLRYPGGKRKLASFITDIIIDNGIEGGTYAEPFAGGASIALHLLFSEYVRTVRINDVDRSIYAFWYAVLFETENLSRKISDTPITMDEWGKQRLIQSEKNKADLLELGFSTFFLNRTNRSGIIQAGVIGGKEQAGTWKMDVRFNKGELIRRIQKIALFKNRIHIYNLDAMDFIGQIEDSLESNSLTYFDPPYYNKGAALYTNSFTHQDHEALAGFIKSLDSKWVLTYDYAPQILKMYDGIRKKQLSLTYTAAEKALGREMIAFSSDLIVPEESYSAVQISSIPEQALNQVKSKSLQGDYLPIVDF